MVNFSVNVNSIDFDFWKSVGMKLILKKSDGGGNQPL